MQIAFDEVPPSDLIIRLGEKLDAEGTIDRHPSGSVTFQEIVLRPQSGRTIYQVEIPTQPMRADEMAVAMPPEIGEVTPFRYAEIGGAAESLDASRVLALFVHATFSDGRNQFSEHSGFLSRSPHS